MPVDIECSRPNSTRRGSFSGSVEGATAAADCTRAICGAMISPEYAVAASIRNATPTRAANMIGRGPITPRTTSVPNSMTAHA